MSIFCFCFRTFHTHFGICYLLNGQMNPFSRVQLYVFSLLPRVLMISPVLKLLIVSHTDQYQKLSFKKKMQRIGCSFYSLCLHGQLCLPEIPRS